jgi:hypothetical protein
MSNPTGWVTTLRTGSRRPSQWVNAYSTTLIPTA